MAERVVSVGAVALDGRVERRVVVDGCVVRRRAAAGVPADVPRWLRAQPQLAQDRVHRRRCPEPSQSSHRRTNDHHLQSSVERDKYLQPDQSGAPAEPAQPPSKSSQAAERTAAQGRPRHSHGGDRSHSAWASSSLSLPGACPAPLCLLTLLLPSDFSETSGGSNRADQRKWTKVSSQQRIV